MARLTTKTQFVELLKKLYPAEYIETLAPEWLEAFGALGERLAEAATRLYTDNIPGRVLSGSNSIGVANFYRLAAGNEITIPSSSKFHNFYANKFVVLEDVTIPSGSLGPVTGSLGSVSKTYQGNLYSGSLLYPLDSLDDNTVYVLTGELASGSDRALEALGYERGLEIQYEETVPKFRKRIRTREPVITRPAIESIIEEHFDDYLLEECFELGGPAVIDDIAGYTGGTDNEGLFYLDYAHADEEVPDTSPNQAWFRVTLPWPLVEDEDLLWLYLGDDLDSSYLGGHLDYQDGYLAQPLWGLMPDGSIYDLGAWPLLQGEDAMIDEIERRKALGVSWYIIYDTI